MFDWRQLLGGKLNIQEKNEMASENNVVERLLPLMTPRRHAVLDELTYVGTTLYCSFFSATRSEE